MITLNKEKIAKYEAKVKKIEAELEKAQEQLDKCIPHKPIVNEITYYDNKKKEICTYYEYFCYYCGEQVYKRKNINKNVSKHKCGRLIDWSNTN